MKLDGLLEDLITTPGVSGYEDSIRERITELIKDSLDLVEVDSLGNLIGVKKGKGEGKDKGHLAFLRGVRWRSMGPVYKDSC